MLIAPVVVGLAASSGGPPAAVVFFCCAALGGFLVRTPLQSILFAKPVEAGAWPSLALYAFLALGGFLPLFFYYDRIGLLGFAVPAAGLLAADLAVQRGRRSFDLLSELSGILVLCLGAPAAFYAARGTLSADAWTAWGLSALFFAGPVFHVKLAALQHRAVSDPKASAGLPRARTISVSYHLAALGFVLAAAVRGAVPLLASVPFAAALAKTWRRGARPPARVDFRALGYREVGYSVLFALSVSAGYLLR